MYITKRDGRKKVYRTDKITDVIINANMETSEVLGEDKLYAVVNEIDNRCRATQHLTTAQAEDIIYKTLLEFELFYTAKAYLDYSDSREVTRENNSELFKKIKAKLDATNIVNQNANVDEMSFGGRKGEATNELMKWFALNNCVSKMARDNHINNEIYIHDLDSYAAGMHNCLSIPFDKLLSEGFNTRQTDIRPASSINTAFQLVAVIFQLQSLQQFGGVSATHLDWTMVPYVRKSFRKHFLDGLEFCENMIEDSDKYDDMFGKDLSIEDDVYKSFDKAYNYAMKMTKRELNQAVEGMYHNLNTLQSRSGNQLPFTSINYGTCTLPEGRMVIRALLEKSIEGVGKVRKTPIFPCGIFQCMLGVNRHISDPNYDLFELALKSTAKRLYPNYANVDWSSQKDGEEYDEKLRQEIIDSLPKESYNKLCEAIKNDPVIGDLLGLELIEGE